MTKKMQLFVTVFQAALFFYLVLQGCSQKEPTFVHQAYIDTTVSVYGPYRAVKLPISSGIKPGNPIQIAMGPGGYVYAANQTGEIYSLRDADGDGLEDMAMLYTNVKDFGLRSPSGFAHRGDTIYIGTAQQIRAFLDVDSDGSADSSWVFFDDIPTSEHPYEWTTGLQFGPDGWLYFALATDSFNAVPSPDPKGYRGSILRISPDGKKVEQLATGIRSVYGISFSQEGELFFADNEGGGNPTEELNRLVTGGFYGHNPSKYTFEAAVGPEFSLEMEVAPSEIEFNAPSNDFGGTAGQLFVAFYGPGERWNRGGVSRVDIRRQADGTFAYREIPVADIPKLSALTFGKEGSLYLAQHGQADYWYNAVYEDQGAFYKLMYDPALPDTASRPRPLVAQALSKNSVDAGKQLYAERACLGCHSVDGKTELLGPNLRDVAKRMSREEIMEEVLRPSDRIKPSMIAQRFVKKDGKVLVGRVVNASDSEISIILVGNQVVQVLRSEIATIENEKKSLMYEGLLNGLAEAEKESLLDYLSSLSQE